MRSETEIRQSIQDVEDAWKHDLQECILAGESSNQFVDVQYAQILETLRYVLKVRSRLSVPTYWYTENHERSLFNQQEPGVDY